MVIAAGLHEWLLFVHIVTAMIWVGGALLFDALARRALRDGGESAISAFVSGLRVIGPMVFAPAVVVLLGAGIWLVVEDDAWDFGQSWIQVALGLFAAAFLIGVVYLSRAALAAERAVAAGDYAAATRQLRQWSRAYTVVLVLLLVATWDMVFKPGV